MIMGLCDVGLSSVVVVVCVPHIFFLFSLFTLLLSSCIAYTFILNFMMQQINVLKRHKYTYASVIFHVCICYLILSIYKRVQCRGVLLHCYYIVMYSGGRCDVKESVRQNLQYKLITISKSKMIRNV